MFEDGTPGELFVFVSKQGSTVSGLVDAFAIMVSIALQYHVPLEDITRKFKQTRYDPAGLTSNPDIPKATSILDYIAQWLERRFLGGERKTEEDVSEYGANPLQDGEFDSPPPPPGETTIETLIVPIRNSSGVCCPECGSIMVHEEGCLKCWGCGNSRC